MRPLERQNFRQRAPQALRLSLPTQWLHTSDCTRISLVRSAGNTTQNTAWEFGILEGIEAIRRAKRASSIVESKLHS